MQKDPIIKVIVYWNRKLHIHLGLFLLLFIWLFAFSGLLLNHGDWKFASFWKERKEQKTTMPITVPPNLDSAGMIQNITQQLGIKGDIRELKINQDSVDFRAIVPGHIRNIHVDLKKGLCTQNEMRFNPWGVIRTLHTFNGVDKDNPTRPSGWILALIWKYTMDGIAIGLILLCLSSFIMWYDLKRGRLLGFVLLTAGFISVIYLVFVLQMI